MDDARANEIKELARCHAELAIDTLAEVASNTQAKEAARVAAAKTLLDRGFGAPERRVEQKVDVNIIDQRQAHLEALQLLAKKQAPLIAPPTHDENIQDAQWSEANGDKSSKT